MVIGLGDGGHEILKVIAIGGIAAFIALAPDQDGGIIADIGEGGGAITAVFDVFRIEIIEELSGQGGGKLLHPKPFEDLLLGIAIIGRVGRVAFVIEVIFLAEDILRHLKIRFKERLFVRSKRDDRGMAFLRGGFEVIAKVIKGFDDLFILIREVRIHCAEIEPFDRSLGVEIGNQLLDLGIIVALNRVDAVDKPLDASLEGKILNPGEDEVAEGDAFEVFALEVVVLPHAGFSPFPDGAIVSAAGLASRNIELLVEPGIAPGAIGEKLDGELLLRHIKRIDRHEPSVAPHVVHIEIELGGAIDGIELFDIVRTPFLIVASAGIDELCGGIKRNGIGILGEMGIAPGGPALKIEEGWDRIILGIGRER